MFVRCHCGGKALYDADSCGHEWVTCGTCKLEIERYQVRDIENEWADAVAKNRGKPRRYLNIK